MLTMIGNGLCWLLPTLAGANKMTSRTAHKSAAPKLSRFQITAEELPGAFFFSLTDLRGGCHDAVTERHAIDEYRVDGVEEALFDTLHGLGWEYADITAVARGAEMVTSYGMPTA
jgi:hypothetical protein